MKGESEIVIEQPLIDEDKKEEEIQVKTKEEKKNVEIEKKEEKDIEKKPTVHEIIESKPIEKEEESISKDEQKTEFAKVSLE